MIIWHFTKVCSGGVLPPDYNASKQVLLFTANNNVNKSATITNDGWILIELTGAWTPCRATINGINVAAAQVTASNMTMASIGIYPVKKGDVVASALNNDSSNVVTVKFLPYKE